MKHKSLTPTLYVGVICDSDNPSKTMRTVSGTEKFQWY